MVSRVQLIAWAVAGAPSLINSKLEQAKRDVKNIHEEARKQAALVTAGAEKEAARLRAMLAKYGPEPEPAEAAPTKATKGKSRKRGQMSAAARKRQSERMKQRWVKWRADKRKKEKKKEASKKRRRKPAAASSEEA